MTTSSHEQRDDEGCRKPKPGTLSASSQEPRTRVMRNAGQGSAADQKILALPRRASARRPWQVRVSSDFKRPDEAALQVQRFHLAKVRPEACLAGGRRPLLQGRRGAGGIDATPDWGADTTTHPVISCADSKCSKKPSQGSRRRTAIPASEMPSLLSSRQTEVRCRPGPNV